MMVRTAFRRCGEARLPSWPYAGFALPTHPHRPNNLDDLLARTNTQVTGFLDQFSDVKCTEQVEQEKIGKDGKVELKEESTYDYLVILTNPGGELSLDESRLPVHEAKQDKKNSRCS